MDIMYRSENETPSLPPELFNFHFFGNSYFVTENINKNDETYLRLFCSRQKIMLDHYVLFVMEKNPAWSRIRSLQSGFSTKHVCLTMILFAGRLTCGRLVCWCGRWWPWAPPPTPACPAQRSWRGSRRGTGWRSRSTVTVSYYSSFKLCSSPLLLAFTLKPDHCDRNQPFKWSSSPLVPARTLKFV